MSQKLKPSAPVSIKPSGVRLFSNSQRSQVAKTHGLLCDDENTIVSETPSYLSRDDVSIFGKKTTMKFKQLAKLLPEYKIDAKLQLSIIKTLKELNCWSDDEDDAPQPTHKSPNNISSPKHNPFMPNEIVLLPADDSTILDSMLSDYDQELEEKQQNTVKTAPGLTINTGVSPLSTPGGSPSPSPRFKKASITPPLENSPQSSPRHRKKSLIINTPTSLSSPAHFVGSSFMMSHGLRNDFPAATTTTVTAATGTTAAATTGGEGSKASPVKTKRGAGVTLSTRDQIRRKIHKKAVRILSEKHIEKQETVRRNRLRELMYGTTQYKLGITHKFAVNKVKVTIQQAILNVFERFEWDKMNIARRAEAQRQSIKVVNRAWRNYKLRKLWNSTLRYVDERLRQRRAAALEEHCAYRIRTTYRRLREDRELKEHRLRQGGKHRAADTTQTPAVPVEVSSGQEYLDLKSEASPRPPETARNAPSTGSTGRSSRLATRFTGAFPAFGSSISSSGLPKKREISEFQFSRPDLAPFSTQINAKIQSQTLFKQEPTWEEIASVDDRFVASVKQNKSAAYRALQQLCGLTEQEILNKHKDVPAGSAAKRHFLLNGSSILSL